MLRLTGVGTEAEEFLIGRRRGQASVWQRESMVEDGVKQRAE